MLCRNCSHFHVGADSNPMNVCKDLYCKCESFEMATEDKPVVPNYQKYLDQLESTSEKVKWILDNIEELRESSNKEFVFNYWFLCDHLSDKLTSEVLDRLTDPELIRRTKQKLVESDKAKYGPKNVQTSTEKGLKFNAVFDWVINQ